MFLNSDAALPLLSEVRSWLQVGGIFFVVFKAWMWVKEIREKDLKQIASDVVTTHSELREQTASIVGAVGTNTNEIKELRGDIRTLTTAFVAPRVRAAAARRKKK